MSEEMNLLHLWRRRFVGEDSESGDVYTKLEKLGDLRDLGIISEEEFNAEKKQLLESDR